MFVQMEWNGNKLKHYDYYWVLKIMIYYYVLLLYVIYLLVYYIVLITETKPVVIGIKLLGNVSFYLPGM